MGFTRKQQEAIEARGGNLLVSAAAGSGKTTVMVERVLSLILEGQDISRMLIVTFTRAAASKMRASLVKRLSEMAGEDARFGRQAARIELASISTIHSFLSDFLREHFEAAGIDPAFRICDEMERGALYKQALEECLLAAYERGGEGFSALVHGRSPEEVGALVGEVYGFLMARPDPFAFMREQIKKLAQGDILEYTGVLLRAARGRIKSALSLIRGALSLSGMPGGPGGYLDTLRGDEEGLSGLLGFEYGRLSEALSGFAWARLKSIRGMKGDPLAEQVKSLRDEAKSALKEAAAFVSAPEDRGAEDVRQTAGPMSALLFMAETLEEAFSRLKAGRGALDFADLEHLSLKALSQEDVAQAVRARFDFVFVDEYQDVSEIQERILSRVSREDNRFMVGDVKQSIYRFRQAEPSLFLKMHGLYGQGGQNGRRIDLAQNFRSRPAVLQFANGVFAREMSGEEREIFYGPGEHLTPGAKFPGEDPPVELIMITGKADEPGEEADEGEETQDLGAVEREAMVIARRVRELIGAPLAADPARTVRAGDIVILLRNARRVADVMADTLLEQGIPAYADVGGGYFEVLEVRTMLALLRLIDNGALDLPMLAVLRSPIYGLSSTQLAKIRAAHPDIPFHQAAGEYALEGQDEAAGAVRALFEDVRRWRQDMDALSLADFIWRVYLDTGYLSYAGALPGGRKRQANLHLLLEYAQKYDQFQNDGLFGFLEHVEDLRVSQRDMGAAPTLSEQDDVVRVMTVHKAKGLEFPIVIGARLGAGMRGGQRPAAVEMHPRLGLGMKLTDTRLGTRRDTLSRRAISTLKAEEAFAEELRILYVMLTRAEQQLILVGTVPGFEKKALSYLHGTDRALDPKSYMDILACAMVRMPGGEALLEGAAGIPAPAPMPGMPRVSVQFEHAAQIGREGEIVRTAQPTAPDERALAALGRAYAFEYPYAQDVLAPLKLTVSALSRRVEGPAQLPELAPAPSFAPDQGGGYGAMRGSAVHAVLAQISLLDKSPEGVAGQIARMREEGILMPEEYEAVDQGAVLWLLKSELGARMAGAKALYREWPFTLGMAAAEALPGQGGSRMLVQGIIDCCFLEDGQWVLVDYKTDRGSGAEALLQRYAPQLALYARALFEITGIPVKEKLLCLMGMRRVERAD